MAEYKAKFTVLHEDFEVVEHILEFKAKNSFSVYLDTISLKRKVIEYKVDGQIVDELASNTQFIGHSMVNIKI